MTAALMIRIEVFPDRRAVFANFEGGSPTDRVLGCQAGPNLTPLAPRLISAEGLSW
jgi:hypothetical protein